MIKFEDLKQEILDSIKDNDKNLDIDEEVMLFEGFVSAQCSNELPDPYLFGGPTLPMVVLIGNESGRLYFFALKAILKRKIDW